MRRLLFALAFGVFVSPPGWAATSVVGQTMSTVSISDQTPVDVPATAFDRMSVALPKRYRSAKHFLSITTSEQVACHLDALYSSIDVGGFGVEPDPTQMFYTDREGDESGSISFVTRKWVVPPSSLGGPAIPRGAMVTLRLHSEAGTGCTVRSGVMVVEIAR
jgi:hypothetical protein